MESFSIGTGASLYAQRLLPAMLAAEHEIILVTCYWARSKTLTGICRALEELARRRLSQAGGTHEAQPPPALRVRICFSSRSFFQKLLHTPSRDGYTYPASAWRATLGLPDSALLAAAGIDLVVRSLFFLPFSVMHPKFLVVDRRRAFVPSCNVSWEPWLEACLELVRGPPDGDGEDPINGLMEFYRGVWERDLDLEQPFPNSTPASQSQVDDDDAQELITSPADVSISLSHIPIPATAVKWLPSPHNRNPRFRPFPWQQDPPAPDTPLNSTLLQLFAEARRDIYLQTPNLTAPPAITAVLDALARGVDVTIVTGRRMMVWEQILTAGTTAERCIGKLIAQHRRLCESAKTNGRDQSLSTQPGGNGSTVDVEAQVLPPGALRVSYFRPSAGSAAEEEPVQSHVKMSIFDGENTVLGSGNMDRASWFTSQELGILIRNAAFATAAKNTASQALEGRLDILYPEQ